MEHPFNRKSPVFMSGCTGVHPYTRLILGGQIPLNSLKNITDN